MKRLVFLVTLFLLTAPAIAVTDEYEYCGDMNLFFWNDPSSFGNDYNRLATRPQMEDAKILSVNVTAATGEQTIGSFITEPFPNGKVMGPGLTRYRTFLNVSSAVGITQYNFIPYNVSPSGVETKIFFGVPRTEDVNELVAKEYLTSYARRNFTYFLPGERLLIRVNASTSSVVARDAYFNIIGTEKASMVQVGYWECYDNDQSSYAPAALMFALIGGFIGAIVIMKRGNLK
jgi:hypothetical protein